ncbi:MAG: glycosyltransferase family 39 protein [Methylococcaceae bacterium]
MSACLFNRPLLPVDETRYVSVAWEMWVRHDFLVPYLNGEVYSHKPPLLFWLIQLSWWFFGVNDWALRWIVPLFSLASIALSYLAAGLLWPQRPIIKELVVFILPSSIFWMAYSSLTMFDMILTCIVLMGMCSLLQLQRNFLSLRWWGVYGLAIAGGLLCKGPVVLLHLLPVALLAPWWHSGAIQGGWILWYRNLAYAVLLGIAMALCWAIPAGIAGGSSYRNEIFFGQTSGRLIESFAHQLPWWWYAQNFPLVLLPWVIWQPVWHGVKTLSLKEPQTRFCLAWLVPIFITFSLISGKRLHYLLPILPSITLLLAYVLESVVADKVAWQRWHRNMMMGFAIMGAVVALMPTLEAFEWQRELALISPWWPSLITIAAIAALWLKVHDVRYAVFFVSNISAFSFILLVLGFFQINAYRYDTQPLAQKLAKFMADGQAVAFYTTKYYGQYQFTGRLDKSITVLSDAKQLVHWAKQHQIGHFMVIYKEIGQMDEQLLAAHYPFRNQNIGLISSLTLLRNPDLALTFKP